MALTPELAIEILRGLDFHLYHGKSSGESLLVHSLGVYSLVHAVLPFTQIYSDADKEVMRWAALLHDFGKTSAAWQRAGRGPHRVSLGDIKYEELRSILKVGIDTHSRGVLTEVDLDDILFIVEFHHDSGRRASTPERNRMKDVVSECDRAISQQRISDALVRALNAVIDTVRYRLFTIELMQHPISPLVIGAFDYVLAETGSATPLLYSPTSTLNIGPLTGQLPLIEEVNRFLKDQFGGSKGVLRYDNSNTRIYTEERSFLELASDPDAFIAEATAFANEYCARQRKAAERNPSNWSDEKEEVYLYGRVCGITYNTLRDLCDVDKKQLPSACLMAGARHGAITVQHMELLGFRQPGTTYTQTLRSILERMAPFVKAKLVKFSAAQKPESSDESFRYDLRDLLVPDTDVYPAVLPPDPKREAARDYERYMRKEPLETCPACSQFPQGNLSAAAFPQISPLGGTVEVFYTTHMRLIKKEPPMKKGVSFCGWCSKWWDLIATDPDGKRQLYRLCIMPQHLFGRLEWREILGPAASARIVELGAPGTISSSGVYPHIAVITLRGTDRQAVLRELAADPERGEEQIVDRLYRYGLKGAVIVSNPVSSRHLLTCGSLSIDAAEWPILRTPLRLLNSTRRSYARAITDLQRSPYAFGTFLADGSIKASENEVRKMVEELTEHTGLAFLRDIWIGGGKNRVDNAGKVIRGMNETLRRLKEKEDFASLVDAMTGKGLHLAMATREGHYRPAENRDREERALRLAAEKLLAYRDQTYRRTELVRAMIYTLAYFSRPEPTPQTSNHEAPVTTQPQAQPQEKTK
ncbi:MAG: HD domain-containing protein [Bryobacteraceae bacterium]